MGLSMAARVTVLGPVERWRRRALPNCRDYGAVEGQWDEGQWRDFSSTRVLVQGENTELDTLTLLSATRKIRSLESSLLAVHTRVFFTRILTCLKGLECCGAHFNSTRSRVRKRIDDCWAKAGLNSVTYLTPTVSKV